MAGAHSIDRRGPVEEVAVDLGAVAGLGLQQAGAGGAELPVGEHCQPRVTDRLSGPGGEVGVHQRVAALAQEDRATGAQPGLVHGRDPGVEGAPEAQLVHRGAGHDRQAGDRPGTHRRHRLRGDQVIVEHGLEATRNALAGHGLQGGRHLGRQHIIDRGPARAPGVGGVEAQVTHEGGAHRA